MNTVTLKRTDEEIAADATAAAEAQLSVHAWRRGILNAANGLSRFSVHLRRIARKKKATPSPDSAGAGGA